MKQMSIAKQIRIQRKQNKNRMVGQTFNPSGITVEQIDARENKYLTELSKMSEDQIQEKRDKINEMKEIWKGSWPWKWCVFERYYGFIN